MVIMRGSAVLQYWMLALEQGQDKYMYIYTHVHVYTLVHTANTFVHVFIYSKLNLMEMCV